jgi:L-lactate dehydrogenase (cytochrome)
MREVITNIEDLRSMAERKLPRSLFEYVDAGSYSEITKRRNQSDLEDICLRQRVMADISDRSLQTDILGQPVAMPVAIAPTGLSGMLAGGGRGEILAAQAAKDTGIPFTLSMFSNASMEEIAEKVKSPFWFHLMPLKDRAIITSLLERAKNAGCSAIVATVDWQVPAQIHRNVKNGLTLPPTFGVRNIWQYARKPGWLWSILTSGRSLTMGNFESHYPEARGRAAEWALGQIDEAATWDYIRWIRQNWNGKLIVKGIVDPDDARQAVSMGADAIVVSNHGGTQLDSAPSTIAALPRVVDAVAGSAETFFDGGIRSGQDVVKALAFGAQACLLGRAHLYALGAGGRQGVTTMLDILRGEIDNTLALCGLRTVQELGSHVILDERTASTCPICESKP